MAMNSTGLDKSLLSIKNSAGETGVLWGLEEQLQSSQDSPEGGNFTNRIDFIKPLLVKDKKCTGQ